MKRRSVIGIDVGGTKSAVCLFDAASLDLLSREEFPTNADRGFPAVYEEIEAKIAAQEDAGVSAIGIGVPGLVAQPSGEIRRLPNIPGGEGFALKRKLAERFKLPLAVDNDSNCFALAEARAGAGKGMDVVIGVTMGTGVGGGIVIKGELFRGADGFAAEIGHMLLLPGDPPFETEDKRGDVEQFLSGTAMRKRCAAATSGKDLLEGDACAFLHPDIVRETAWLCANLTHVLNPSVIVFGGSTGRALARYLPAIEEETTRWIMRGTPLPQLRIAKFPHASPLGAAMLAVEHERE